MWLTRDRVWGTFLACSCHPVRPACLRNISPPWLQQPMRLLMTCSLDPTCDCTCHLAVGLGPFAVSWPGADTAGVVASVSEAVEAIDKGPV